ncbi:hypothetical protein HPP92_021780 [Vanilla planifolia]|uniref:Uncharacterized protein n=1 Tax=Vanilla planifolia TaxID=51239 RepID=A0A835PTC3_VANPL|nr:hypothetical protein HPP92_022090 [Vanilla planifolia]KAG0458652.1 hypothetical protein HPP92_021780 [Vanilla planifolia]
MVEESSEESSEEFSEECCWHRVSRCLFLRYHHCFFSEKRTYGSDMNRMMKYHMSDRNPNLPNHSCYDLLHPRSPRFVEKVDKLGGYVNDILCFDGHVEKKNRDISLRKAFSK